MKANERKLLEAVFSAEVSGALRNAPHVYQTRSKLAEKLAADGLIRKVQLQIGRRFPVTVEGYELTELGRLTYCATC